MNRIATLAILGIVFAVAIGLGMTLTNAFSVPLFSAAYNEANSESPMGMYGHLTLIARDADGTILRYIQSDNTIVNVGENCVAELLFDVDTTGTNGCDDSSGATTGGFGATPDGFTFIAVGDNATGIASPTLQSEETAIGLTLENTTSTMVRKDVTTPGITQSSGTSSSAVVVLSADFTSEGGTSDVDESGLFDDVTTGGDENMFARQTFSNVRLSAGDVLTVEWTITIGG